MIKTATELALMQGRTSLASLRYAGQRTREGMTSSDIDHDRRGAQSWAAPATEARADRRRVFQPIPTAATSRRS
jgi:hypothetical protein